MDRLYYSTVFILLALIGYLIILVSISHKAKLRDQEVLKECPCTGELEKHILHGQWNGGEFECHKCHTRTPARVVNK